MLFIPDMGTRSVVIGRPSPMLVLAFLVGCTSGTARRRAQDRPPPWRPAWPIRFARRRPPAAERPAAPRTAGGGTTSCSAAMTVSRRRRTSDCRARATLPPTSNWLWCRPRSARGCSPSTPRSRPPAQRVQDSLTCTTLGSGPDVQTAIDDPLCAGLFIGYIPVNERCDMSAECISARTASRRGPDSRRRRSRGAARWESASPTSRRALPATPPTTASAPRLQRPDADLR